MRFSYPTKEIYSFESFYKTTPRSGFYPIGTSNKWHGGVHIFENNPILAIADGKIVAYRLEGEDDSGKECENSNNFILIKHQCKGKRDQDFTFYSLYYHLLSYNQMNIQKKMPGFFCKKVWELTANRNLQKWDDAKKDVNKTNSGIIKMIPKNTVLYEVELSGTEVERIGFQKVKCTVDGKELTGFMNMGETKEKKEEWKWNKDKFPSEKEKVKSGISIPVKAGELIAYPGKWDDDRLFHLEIFATQENEVKDLLTNKKEYGKKEKLYFKLPEGTEISKQYPRIIPKGWKVEVTEGDKFATVNVISKDAVVSKNDLNYNKKSNLYTIKIIPESIKRLDKEFDGLLRLYSTLKPIADPAVERDANGKDTNKRRVQLDYPLGPSEFEVPKDDIRLNNKNELEASLNTLYNVETQNKETKLKLADTQIFEIYKSLLSNIKYELWIYIEDREKKDKKGEAKYGGWIKYDDIKSNIISRYDWEKWGFELKKEAPDIFIYEPDDNSFMKTVCNLIEDTAQKSKNASQTVRINQLSTSSARDEIIKDGKISFAELQRALKNRTVREKLSRLVCCHTSEWAGDITSKAYCEQKKKQINEKIEENEAKGKNKEDLEKYRDEKCEELKEKIDKLGFWKDVSDLPGNAQVFYFHPIAFIEQMMRIHRWHDPVLNPQINKYQDIGEINPHKACFGNTRVHADKGKRFHSGLDIFAIPEITPVYAPLDCEYVDTLYTSSITLKIIDNKELIAQMNRVNYQRQFINEGEYLAGKTKSKKKGEKVDEFILGETDIIHLVYHHIFKKLSRSEVEKDGIVKAGTLVGYAGVEGNADGIRSPHLHLDVINKSVDSIYGTNCYRLNPALFVKLNTYSRQQDEAAKTSWRDKANKSAQITV